MEKAGRQARYKNNRVGGWYPVPSTLSPHLGLYWQAEGEGDLDRRAYAGEYIGEQSCFAWMPLGLRSGAVD